MVASAAPPPSGRRSARISVRKAGPADLDTIDAIERASFDKDRFARRALGRLLASPTVGAYLAHAEAHPAGYVLLLYRKGAKAARLYSIATRPEARGEGVGGALMDAAAQDAVNRGCDRLRLEARISNAAAVRVYERQGFTAVGERPGYYSDGETALLMEKRLVPRADESL